MENGRDLTEKFWEEIIMNRKLKTDFRFLLTKATQTVDCDAMHFCVFLCVSNFRCVLVCMLTYECFIGKEFSNNKSGKFQYILSTPIRKIVNWGKRAQSAGGISQYS